MSDQNPSTAATDPPHAHLAGAGLTIRTIETPSLGDRSYLVHDGEVAFVVDPQRDIDRILALLRAEGVRLTHVFETHIHNDYVTGGLALAQASSAKYLVNADDKVSFDRTPIHDGDLLEIGERMRVRAIHTPGHTFTHLSYALTDGDEPIAVFTGGSLLYGATGRPDLLGPDHTDALVRHQHASAHKLADTLPDQTGVYPTHGFGSFCSATQSEATSSTIGQEKQANPVLTQDEEDYVRELLDGLGAWPAYYVHMAPANSAGPAAPDLSLPEQADPAELRRRVEAGEWVVDLRTRTAFAAGHAPGTLNFGLDGAFSTYVGWLIGWGTPVTLLGETATDVAQAQRELVRIGIDRPAAHATGGPGNWSADAPVSFPTATFADLEQVRHHRDVVVLDVRRAEEHDAAWIEGAVNIPIHELPAGQPRCHQAKCGCTAPPATAPPSPRRSSTPPDAPSSRSTTSSRTRQRPVSTWSDRRRDLPVMIVVAVLAGALIGLSLGTLGGGGSILAVPVLVYLLDQSAVQATTGSLIVVGVTSFLGTVTAYRAGNVLLGRGVVFGIVAIGGAVLGGQASTRIPPAVLMASFALLMLIVGGVMAWRQLRHSRPATRPALDDPIITFTPTFACACPRALKVLVTATLIGLLTGFLGVGGGFLVVPALLLALGLPIRYAAGTSSSSSPSPAPQPSSPAPAPAPPPTGPSCSCSLPSRRSRPSSALASPARSTAASCRQPLPCSYSSSRSTPRHERSPPSSDPTGPTEGEQSCADPSPARPVPKPPGPAAAST